MYKDTKCRSCATQDKPLFAMDNMKDNKDFFCDPCQKAEVERRAKNA